ncbi:hypothetical protein JCM30471_25420 [Desulfuromonas carbonis]|uniref:alpha/beta hydrolase family protein n=1 Tax=Desulfuromonas sp. DDH964 TaxID=1823759 RepID=UPI00078E4D49|nr:prolyl oligopeptidase family serine peptidase [Desulfuromonas sp. DDH964]AMV70549.1 hypothetical protein DBW_0149 [Desulfuromonas sp. DDH964]
MSRKDLDSMGVREIRIPSLLDGSAEPNLYFIPEGDGPFPLLVALHTWSFDRFNQLETLLPLCRERSWALLLPEARGPNLAGNPHAEQAAGSPLARQDVLDATAWITARFSIDRQRLFLLGGSGGGQLALLVAAADPARWRAVSVWVPITDLALWHGEASYYAPHIEACLGGPPGASADIDRRYRERSPLEHAAALTETNLFLHHGRFDPLVPWQHSWRLAERLHALGARRFFLEIFDGEHDIQARRALDWFSAQGGRVESGWRLTG